MNQIFFLRLYTPFGEVASTHESVAAERTKLMLQYIQAHYSEELTLEQIAASAAVSKSMCLRFFRYKLFYQTLP